jgi:hypothetical protein
VSPAGLYRVGGGSYRGSEPFTMPRPAGSVDVSARMTGKGKHIVGVVLSVVGGVTLGVGGLLLAVSTGANDTSAGPGTLSPKSVLEVYGVVYAITGAILLAVGAPMASSSTSVEVR